MQINWKGSLGSLSIGRRSKTPCEDKGIAFSANGEQQECKAQFRKHRRKSLRKRFNSLTDGLTGLLSSEKNSESLSRQGSKESLKSLQLPTSSDFISRPTDNRDDARYVFDWDLQFNRQAGSLSSFQPVAKKPKCSQNKPEENRSEVRLSQTRTKSQSPAIDRLKKAPPSPPPRRFSRIFRNSRCNLEDPLADAVVSSSLGFLPSHLRPPPPPPPIRLSKAPSQSPGIPKKPKSLLKSPSGGSFDHKWKKSSIAGTPSNSRPHSPFIHGKSPSRTNDPNAFKTSLNSLKSTYSDSSRSGAIYEKTVSIILQKENGTFGFTVRGGASPDGISRALLVTHVRPGGPADKEGSLKAGDRLVSLDGRDLTRVSLAQAQIALQEVERSATLGIKFDVSIMDSVRYAGGPLLVEIERTPGTSLGIYLNYSKFNNSGIYSSTKNGFNQIFIESMLSASIAERCGALAIGDTVSSVSGIRLDRTNVHEANEILREGQGSKVTLEIIPNNKNYSSGIDITGSSSLLSSPSSQRYSMYHTIGPNRHSVSTTTRRIQRRLREEVNLSPIGVSHSETLRATLLTEGRNSVGIAMRPPLDSTYPFVAALDPGGAADKCGVICIGDRILAVNGRNVSGLGISEINQMLSNTRPTVIIDVEFEVADSVVPSTGTFSVKLSKRHNDLGICFAKGKTNGSKRNCCQDDAILICDILRGSPAHRTGTLQVGDRLLAIENTRVDGLTIEDTMNILQAEGDIVTLKVQKDDLHTDENDSVVYTVQLLRDGRPLGIGAAGTEEPFDPIFIRGISTGSLAAQTGAIHVGDRLLAINDISLRGKPISEAVRLLQGTEHTIALKVSRPKNLRLEVDNSHPTWGNLQPPLSVDSAVESWDSGGFDNSAQNSNKNKTNSSPNMFKSKSSNKMQREPSITNKDAMSLSWNSTASTDSGQSEEDKTDWDKMIEDLNEISATCGLRDASLAREETSKSNGNLQNCSFRRSTAQGVADGKVKSSSEPSISSFKMAHKTPETFDEGAYSVSKATALHRATTPSSSSDFCNGTPTISMTLTKDPFYEDFGFSVSDGLYEKGVYVNRIRRGGPADKSGLLFPFDRILQVNDAQTEDFDCCLTVPLIAAADSTLYLKVVRQNQSFNLAQEFGLNAWFEGDEDSGLASNSFTKEFL